MRRQFRTLSDTLSYQVFLVTYLLSYVEAIASADLVIDMELLDTSWLYRHMIELAISEGTGFMMDFADCHVPVRKIAKLSIDRDHLTSRVVMEVLAALDGRRSASHVGTARGHRRAFGAGPGPGIAYLRVRQHVWVSPIPSELVPTDVPPRESRLRENVRDAVR